MGLFGKSSDSKNIEYYIEKLKNENMSFNLTVEDLEDYRRVFNNDELLGNILLKLTNYSSSFTRSILDNSVIIYNDIVKKGTYEEISLFKKINEYFIDAPYYIGYYQKLSSAFDNKELILESLNNIKINLDLKNIFDNDINEDNMGKLLSYPLTARQYYLDDRQLFSAFASLIEKGDIRDYLFSDSKIDKVINKKLKEDKKQNGIYDIDIGTLAELSHKLDMIDSESSNLKTLINTATSIIQEVKVETKNSKDELIELKIKGLKEIQNQINKKIADFDTTYLELLNKEKQTLNDEKQELFAELEREISKRKKELSLLSEEFSQSVTLKLGQVNTATSNSIRQIEEFINNNDSIKQMITETRNNEDFIATLKEINKNISENSVVTENTTPNLIIPNVVAAKTDRVLDSKINYFYDENIPFQERYEKFLQLKEEETNKGVIFHEKFDDIVKLIMLGQTPYMYGPSGCGKTYMVESQISNLLGTNVVTNGYILYEQDIIGYTNSATGDYVPGNFNRSYKFGDMIFLDELDNGIANATVVLNRFLGKDNKSYMFPDGLVTNRHPNFRIITAGNTIGEGRTLAHNTRQKMDESVMQRLVPVEVDYDNRIEKNILKDYQDWYYFAINFRKAIESIPGPGGERNTMGTFTTRDANSIKTYLDDKAFDMEQILEYEIIQTKDIYTLTKLASIMNDLANSGEFKKGSEKILKKYNQLIENRRDTEVG